MHYEIKRILTYEQPIKMVVGGRGIGKTYSTKVEQFSRKLKNPKYEAIWLYRYDTDITPEKVERWADDLPIEMQDLLVCGERKIQWINENGEKTPFITFVALSKYGVNKGTPYPYVEDLVFDEFLVDKDSKYLKNEIFAFKQWIQTIFRKRKINVIMLANALTIDNPYFTYFKVKRVKGQEFFKNKKIVVQYPKNTIYDGDEKIEINTYRGLFDDEETRVYDIEGDFYFDTEEFICENKPRNAKPQYKININNRVFTIYETNKFLWVCEKDTQNVRAYSLLKNDIKPNYLYVPQLSKLLLDMYANGELWFSDITTRNAVKEVF